MKQEEETESLNQVLNKDLFWCRKCMTFLPEKEFYGSVDKKLVDSSGKFSVCKKCIIKIYDQLFAETNSIEKTIQKMCTTLNVKYSNSAMDATKAHISTLIDGGKKVNAIFSIFLMKLFATNPSMDKSVDIDLTYSDVGTIFTSDTIDTKKIPIPKDLVDFWGSDVKEDDIRFLENEYIELKSTHKSDTRAEVLLLKQVCFCLLDIKRIRLAGDDTGKLVKELQDLMKNLAISPNVANATANLNKGDESFGLWIQDIEREEPAQWLKTDPRADPYRDVTNVEEYFQKYIVRPLKNFITDSRDFNVDESIENEAILDLNIPEDNEPNKEELGV